MAAVTVNQPVTVDAKGNISVHGRAGLYLPIPFQDGDGLPLDATTWELYFEVKGKFRRPLLAAPAGYGTQYRVVALSQTDVSAIGTSPASFALVDYTAEVDSTVIPKVRWEGQIAMRGFTAQPTDEPAL